MYIITSNQFFSTIQALDKVYLYIEKYGNLSRYLYKFVIANRDMRKRLGVSPFRYLEYEDSINVKISNLGQ